MIVPDEFTRFASAFYQGSDREAATLQDWIASGLRRLDVKEREVLRKFLADTLNAPVDEAELRRIWDSTSADYYITGHNGMRAFLTMIRDDLNNSRI